MSIWAILRNIGTVIAFFRAFAGLIEGVAKNKSVPPIDQIKDLLDKAEALLDSGAIDIPGIDEKSISDAIKQIEEQLCRPSSI